MTDTRRSETTRTGEDPGRDGEEPAAGDGALGSDAPRDAPDLARLTERLRGPLGWVAVATLGILLLGVLTALRVGKAVALPVILALLLNFVLSPIVRALGRARIPPVAAAGLVLLFLLGATGYGVYRLARPASAWVQSVPDVIEEAEWKLRGIREPVEEVQKAAEEVERLASMEDGERSQDREVEVTDGSVGKNFFERTRDVLAGGLVMFFLLFFLLASGDLFLRKLAHVLPRFHHRRRAVVIVRRTERQVSRYLLTFGLINLGLGLAVGLAMWLLEMPNPVLWAVMAAALNFVPYLGPLVGIVITGLVAITTFDSMSHAVAVPLCYFLLNAIEGNLVTPLIMGRRLTLNPVAIFIGVMFWGWLWGVPGALLAVPLLAVIKIICDNIELLTPMGEFLGR